MPPAVRSSVLLVVSLGGPMLVKAQPRRDQLGDVIGGASWQQKSSRGLAHPFQSETHQQPTGDR